MKDTASSTDKSNKETESKVANEAQSAQFVEATAQLIKVSSKSSFRNVRMWFVILGVYISIFGYIGYVAFWPMSFNDPEQTVAKYFEIIDQYAGKFDNVDDSNHFRDTITDLISESESEAGDMQQLASQSFNIVLGAFLAFLSATVTTIFQSNNSN